MAKSQSFTETVIQNAHRKVETAGARTQADPTLEQPKHAIRAGCTMIAEALAGDGYRFIKTNPRLQRVVGDLRFEIGFQPARFNIPAGARRCTSMAAYRRSRCGNGAATIPMTGSGTTGRIPRPSSADISAI
jgi:hypothetical protein